MKNNSFRPGQVWLDTEGKRIQAHGGSVYSEDGIYYWYGENKEYTTGDTGIWTWGVRCYSSVDLYNWEDKGLIIQPDLSNPDSSLNPKNTKLDRPHIIYNANTKKYVCWVKLMNPNGTQTATILTADRFLGPYTLVKEGVLPLGMSAGDFDLAVAEDGKAYYYFERVHSETICAELTPDYLDLTGQFSTHFPNGHPPFVREATAHFERKGKHYLVTSGTSGYMPNPSEVAVSDFWHGPFKVLGDPCPCDESHTSYHSQISCIFKVHGKSDLYIACADRWVPDHMDIPYEFYRDLFSAGFTDGLEKMCEVLKEKAKNYAEQRGIDFDQAKKYMENHAQIVFADDCRNTSIANYVWLPLRFIEPCDDHPDGMVIIDWLDEWRVEDYE